MIRILSAVLAVSAAAAASASPLDEFKGWKKNIVEESVDIGAFEHGDFESGVTYGPYRKIGEIGRFGVNGGGGLRLRPAGKTFSFRFPLKARLEKGKRYVFSADVRPHGNIWGRTVMDAMFVKPRKYASGCGAWGTCYTKLSDGWTHQYVEVVAKHEPEKMDYHFMIYGGGADTNAVRYIDVDNVRIELAAPKWYLCNTWPTHDLIHGDTGRIRFNSSFYGDFFAPGAKPVYGCRLTDASGKTLAERAAVADGNGNFTLDFGALAHRGAARLTVTLYDRAAREERGARSFDVTVRVPDRGKGIYVRENGVVLKDGKPFMPLGFYTGLADAGKHDLASVEYHLRRLSEAGFDTIMDYQTYSLKGERRDAFYRLCTKYGIWVLADDFKVGVKSPTFKETLEKRYRPLAEKLTEYPAIIGFYTMDESSEDCVPNLTLLRRMLNEVAPDRIVNTCNIMRAAPFLPTADIQGGDSYPVNRSRTCSLRDPWGRVSKLAACDPAAIWYAPQCFNWARMTPGAKNDPELYRRSGREPTMEEMLSVALCMVADRTTGFLFYSHFDMIECPVPEYREARWKAMCEIAKKLRDLEPFIMSGGKIVQIPCADTKGTVRAVVLSDGKGANRIVVTGLDLEHDSTFALPAGCARLRPTTGRAAVSDGVCRFRGGAFSCDILK